MEDIVIGIGEKILECMAGPILDRSRYLFCLKKFTRELNEAKTELKAKLEEVKERIEQATQKGEAIMHPVKNWLDDVEKILTDVQELQEKVEGEGKSCFNMSHRYSLAKQMDGKAKRMLQLKNDFHFEEDHFSCLPPIPGLTYFSSKDFVDFNSRKSTSNHLLDAVKEEKNKMIGLYGMGGSGKTTLAKEVGKRVQDLKIFEKVVFVVVSKPPNVAKLQQEIAEQIGLKFKEESILVRAQRLSEQLKNKKIFIIMDDVWEYLNLEDIGIPLVEGCHILLTTRLQNVCISMGCNPRIDLPLINKEEAWELFKKCANIDNDDSNMFHDVGRNIVDECKELPIAIVVVGSSLKGKPFEKWESALWRLKHFKPVNVEKGLTSPYACLELSYDSLTSPTAKSLFLLCSMFPEDHEIRKEDLIRFGHKTLELEENIDTMEDVRREISVALIDLLDSCLLMSINNQACVKMHDLVRDVALWIANKQRQTIVVGSNNQSLRDTKVLSLWNLDENFKLSNQLCCSTLDIILLQPHGFIEDFEGVKALKVLALTTSSFRWSYFWWTAKLDCSFSQSIVSLTNLHTLCLREKKLGDISFLGELKGLEILDLHGSLFNELPAGIVNMKMLKLLDVFACEIEKSPLEVIGRCEQFEELYMWDNKSTILNHSSLPNLKRYVICDATCEYVNPFGSRDDFTQCLDSLDHSNEAMRALSVQGLRVSASNSSMKNLICKANCLRLENCWWDHKHINLFEIKHLWVLCCQEKRFIIDNIDAEIPQTQKVFSHLITLRLIDMNSLEQVFRDSSISFSPPMLQDLVIQNCPKLGICIFTHSMITSPPKLRRLKINGCNKVKWLFFYSLASHCPSLEKISIRECNELEGLIDEGATHRDPLRHDMQNDPYPLILFPKLKKIEIMGCYKVRWLLPYFLASHCPSLEEISIGSCSELEGLIDEGATHGDPLLHDMQNDPYQPLILFPKLKKIEIMGCYKVRCPLPYSVVSHCPSLEEIYIRSCSELEGLIDEGATHGDPLLHDMQNDPYPLILFPKLKKILIWTCNKVRWSLPYSLASHCPSLEEISIHSCSELEGLIDGESDEKVAHGSQQLLKLKELSLNFLPKLMVVFGYEYKLESLHDKEESQQQQKPQNERVRVVNSELESIDLSYLVNLDYIWQDPTQIVSLHKLVRVSLWGCLRLRNIFTLATVTSLPELRALKVRYCDEWEGIFCEESLKNLSASIVCFPKLETIYIGGCHKVRRLFSYSLASHCPSLETITIDDCSQLEGVVQAYEGEVVSYDKKLFPELNYLELERLPKLREIYTDYEFIHLSGTINIEDCPNICNIPLKEKASSDLEIEPES